MGGEIIPIAATPESLTPEWLTEALTAAGQLDGATVEQVSLKPLGTGQMCDSVRLSLTYRDETSAPRSIVAKLPAADETSRTTAIMMRSYEKEVRFYRELVAGLNIRTPEVYYADIDSTGGTFVLLLEDLAPATQGDQLAGCSPEVASAALRQLVGLHAPRWADPAINEIEWLRGDVETGRQMMLVLLPTLWDGFLERYADQIGDTVRDAGRSLFASLGGYLAEGAGPRTIVHGDYRLDNLLIDPQTNAVSAVDWQTCTVGNALADVAYFIGAGLLPDDRRLHERGLVAGYHHDLRAAGVDGYDWDTCWRDYRRGTWSGLVMAVGASMLVERTTRGDEMFLAMASRHAQHAVDLDAAELIA